MAYDKVIDSAVLDAGLKQIADAIREKGGTTDSLAFPAGMADAIAGIEAGGDIDALINRSITEMTTNVTFIGDYAFYRCMDLENIDAPMCTRIGSYAFYNAPLKWMNFPLVREIGEAAFGNNQNKGNYETVIFPSVTKIGSNAFSNARNLIAINTNSFPLLTKLDSYTFNNCSALTKADFPSVTSISSAVFMKCNSLTKADFPLVTSISSYAFSDCNSLTSLILRSTTMATLSNTNAFSKCYRILGTVDATYNPDGLKDGYIYVPFALVDSYKAATNWSTYASQIRALEDYTVDGTITGELDPNKI